MIDTDEQIHLAGYASLAAILGTAEWSNPLLGWALATPIALVAIYFGGIIALSHLESRAPDLGVESEGSQTPIATDGGSSRAEEIVAGIDEHGSGAIRDEVLIDELQETTGSDRKRPDQH